MKSTLIPLLAASLVLMPFLAIGSPPASKAVSNHAYADCSGCACCADHSATRSTSCCRHETASKTCELPTSEPCESDCGQCPCCMSPAVPVVYLTSAAADIQGVDQFADLDLASDRLISRNDEPLLPPPIA